MPWYHTLGEIPRKRHTAFRQADGSLFGEHLMGSLGFSGPSTLLYHRRRPTSVLSSKLLKTTHWQADPDETLRMRHLRLNDLPTTNSPTLDRTPVLFNHDVALTLHPSGLPHRPHPGRAEESVGKKRTEELAVMLDTFCPLKVSRDALTFEDPAYGRSWLDSEK